ncbi:hypothetical protein K474DRAFT_1679886 [Panus rudis PR-1116 ss-1]|nr:hypothetical protein K474DRAFT_1679886 [Panus rudis PR-1116 ss-1]
MAERSTIPFDRLVEMPPPPTTNIQDDPMGRMAMYISNQAVLRDMRDCEAYERHNRQRESLNNVQWYNMPGTGRTAGPSHSQCHRSRAARRATTDAIFFGAAEVGVPTNPSTPVNSSPALAPAAEILSPAASVMAINTSFGDLSINALPDSVGMDMISLPNNPIDLTRDFINNTPSNDVDMNMEVAEPIDTAATDNVETQAEDSAITMPEGFVDHDDGFLTQDVTLFSESLMQEQEDGEEQVTGGEEVTGEEQVSMA